MRLSQRVQKIKPSPTLEITAKAGKLKAQGIDVVSFGAGEPDFDTPDYIKAGAIEALKSGFTKYTAVGGIDELKDAIIAKLKRDNGLTYSREEILVSNGGKHSLYNAAEALFEAGDEVIIPAPYWVSYPDQVILNDATPVFLETTDKTGFKVLPEQLEKAIAKKTKAFILNSPSNPTGAAYSKEELEKLAAILLKNKVVCISDEIYEKIIYDGFKHVSIASLSEEMKNLTLVVNGASKVYSMTGWRMGFAAGPKELIAAMTKIQGQSTSNISSITQKAALAAYTGDEKWLGPIVTEFKTRRDFIVQRLNTIPGIKCLSPQGAFYVFPNIAGLFGKKTPEGQKISNSRDLCNYLLDKHLVAAVSGEGFGAEGFMRLSYATSMKNIEKGLARIEKALNDLR
ncbi:MAG: pyridoxal phosphate-dependent aminotransferase [Deltaproteobacteria bacterium]|nr:pyridoxal phosphate-dependent aminotransferase [Deltaproteobacteria bacterium]